jgi:hypothetical protein
MEPPAQPSETCSVLGFAPDAFIGDVYNLVRSALGAWLARVCGGAKDGASENTRPASVLGWVSVSRSCSRGADGWRAQETTFQLDPGFWEWMQGGNVALEALTPHTKRYLMHQECMRCTAATHAPLCTTTGQPRIRTLVGFPPDTGQRWC